MNEQLLRETLIAQLLNQGFSRVRILNPLPEMILSGHTNQPYPEEARSAVLGFFPYYRGDLPQSHEMTARIAPFARRNNYKEAVTRFKRVFTQIRRETGMVKSQGRIFCNSRYPEKQMAWQCGLGSFGRNSLIITPEYGSLGVIAGLFLPFELPGDNPLEKQPYDNCGTCRNCTNACPGRAIEEGGGLNRELCFQHLSTSHEVLSPSVSDKWGEILYGCQICQDVCPLNRNKPEGQLSELGLLGTGLKPVYILNCTDEELKCGLKGTVLGQSWITSAVLKRNALLCAVPSVRGGEENFINLVKKYTQNSDPILSETARTILERD